jgi:hypothetical protein
LTVDEDTGIEGDVALESRGVELVSEYVRHDGSGGSTVGINCGVIYDTIAESGERAAPWKALVHNYLKYLPAGQAGQVVPWWI